MKKNKPLDTIKMFCCDLNWVRFDEKTFAPASASDWATIDPKEYFNWHKNFGNNIMFCQAYLFGGSALYPSKLGPLAPGRGSEILPRLFDLSKKAKMPFISYFCIGADLATCVWRPNWLVPGSFKHASHGFLAPESPWTDLLCERIEEFLREHPVDWLLFDWFVYGSLKPDDFKVQPAQFARKNFMKIIGREMPDTSEEITPEENLKYKREILAWQFRRIRNTVKKTSPATKIMFNVPYWEPNEALWENHPMLNESDSLFAECSRGNVMQWLLSKRKSGQRLMTTVIGRVDANGLDSKECDPNSWVRWHEQGCDLMGYAWGTPPDFRPHHIYKNDLKIIRNAFRKIPD